MTKVVLFSKTGGSVTYQSPAVPVLGNVIIGTAPLFGIPLVLAGLTWIFGTYIGCAHFSSVPALDSFTSTGSLLSSAALIVYQNLIAQFNGWFLL